MTAKTPEEKAAFVARMKAARSKPKQSSAAEPAMRTEETVIKPTPKPAPKPKSKTPPKESPADDDDEEPGIGKYFL